MKRRAIWPLGRVAMVLILSAAASAELALADATLTGNCWIPKVKGQTSDYLALYEWNIWLNKDGTGYTGQSFRVGASGSTTSSQYTFTGVPAGTYSLYLDEPRFWGRPTVIDHVVMPSSGTVNLNVEIPSDYGCAFGGNSGPWGDNPWTAWKPAWYQTFIATGTSVTGINFKVAGTSTSDVAASIIRDNGGSITTWPQVGISRIAHGVGSLNDNWLRFRSNEIPTVPDQRYALKLVGQTGGTFAIFRRIEDGFGYTQGQAYDDGGAAQNFDIYANVFSDNDGTVIPYCCVQNDGGNLAGWDTVWSQEVRAIGNGLAGATLYYAVGSDPWQRVGTMRVRSGSVTGPQVGPAKVANAASMASTAAFFTASWNPGEVALTPGQNYFIELDCTNGSPAGYNAQKFTISENNYAYGHAWKNYVSVPNVYLHMQVVEYGNTSPPTTLRSPASFTRSVVRRTGTLPNDTFTIRNSGGGVLRYTISNDAAWLNLSASEGYSINETDTITMSYDTASLAIGSYTGTITINAPGATNPTTTVVVNLAVTPPPFAPCDFDHDHDVDQGDFGTFQQCYSGPGVDQSDPACSGARLDGDEDVDSADFAIFMNCFSGANVTVDTMCAG
jgi:hypothetical protein